MALVRRSRDMRPGDDGYINIPEGETMLVLEGHTNGIFSVIQLTDGRLVSCSDDRKIKIWDTISGCCMMTLMGHTHIVFCVIQLTDGRLVSGGGDKTIKLWDTISGSCLMTLDGHTFWVCCLIQLNDGRLVSGGGDGTIKIWDTISGSCMMTLEGHTHSVRCVIQLTDGRLVSGGDATLRIWNIMSLSHQKWTRRRLLVLLFEASKILSEPIISEVIRYDQYLRRRNLKSLIQCVLNISNGLINLKTFKQIILRVTSNSDIVQLIAAYL